jgi:hypothetical protein
MAAAFAVRERVAATAVEAATTSANSTASWWQPAPTVRGRRPSRAVAGPGLVRSERSPDGEPDLPLLARLPVAGEDAVRSSGTSR